MTEKTSRFNPPVYYVVNKNRKDGLTVKEQMPS